MNVVASLCLYMIRVYGNWTVRNKKSQRCI